MRNACRHLPNQTKSLHPSHLVAQQRKLRYILDNKAAPYGMILLPSDGECCLKQRFALFRVWSFTALGSSERILKQLDIGTVLFCSKKRCPYVRFLKINLRLPQAAAGTAPCPSHSNA